MLDHLFTLVDDLAVPEQPHHRINVRLTRRELDLRAACSQAALEAHEAGAVVPLLYLLAPGLSLEVLIDRLGREDADGLHGIAALRALAKIAR